MNCDNARGYMIFIVWLPSTKWLPISCITLSNLFNEYIRHVIVCWMKGWAYFNRLVCNLSHIIISTWIYDVCIFICITIKYISMAGSIYEAQIRRNKVARIAICPHSSKHNGKITFFFLTFKRLMNFPLATFRQTIRNEIWFLWVKLV